jgi:peptide/nickel transport system ATP-binding protein
LGVVVHLCDRVGVMQQGRIVDVQAGGALVAGHGLHAYTRGLVDATRDATGRAAANV